MATQEENDTEPELQDTADLSHIVQIPAHIITKITCKQFVIIYLQLGAAAADTVEEHLEGPGVDTSD